MPPGFARSGVLLALLAVATVSAFDQLDRVLARGKRLQEIAARSDSESDQFGIVSISADGNTLSVAARQEDGNGAGVSAGDFVIQNNNTTAGAGAVYLY